MLNVNCAYCGKDLEEPGGILLSPPNGYGHIVSKWHICKKCYEGIKPDFDKQIKEGIKRTSQLGKDAVKMHKAIKRGKI